MSYRRMPGHARSLAIALGLVLGFSVPRLQAAELEAYLVVKWEGRELEEPNLDALDGLRKKFPEVPVIHLINPSYFKESAQQSGENLEAIGRRILASDEVGLYLAPSAGIVKAADVLPIRKPTFWSYSDEVCTKDCGLGVPMTAYSRSEVVKLIFAAHSTLQEFGFRDLQSFAVHGFIHPAGSQDIAASLGYANDLTAVDLALVKDHLKEFPVGNWLASNTLPKAPASLNAWTQAGGLIEYNNDDEILGRFKTFFSSPQEKASAFIVSVSQENIFMNAQRLERSIQGMREQASAKGDQLVFQVMTKGKKGRPVAKNKDVTPSPAKRAL